MLTQNTSSKLSQYEVKLPTWNGPLDLLLDLIRSSEVNIFDIPIFEITQQYLDAIKMMQKMDIDLASDFLAMAVTLIMIKSKMLLPVEMQSDEDFLLEDPRKDLVDKLIEYQKYKAIAEELENSEFHAERIIERKDCQTTFDVTEGNAWEDVTIYELLKVFSGFVEAVDKMENYENLEEDFRVEDKLDFIKDQFKQEEKIEFYSLFGNDFIKNEVIVTFLAILELYKLNYLLIRQHRVFGDMYLFKKS